ncbi:aminodeoxychorismate lyase [Kangiella shandongensis]|uniref:aminodeoxychorismate lyase n=1 Tax=Kangiella shandongensis TaxID=2763258 RepID=UPI001CBD2D6B|nr:aminodeoxychorismate lyase [Kangiella shandongensis]
MPKHLVNGQPDAFVESSDRGLLYGDGFFTTIRIRNAQIEHWPLHIERINSSSAKLKFPAVDVGLVEREIHELVASQVEKDGVIRLTITRGSGLRGYKAPSNPKLNRIASWSPFVPPGKLKDGVELSICGTPYSKNSALAGIKHLNRLEQVLAQEEIPQSCFDGIMLADDLIIGGSKTNIFFCNNGKWFTPSLLRAGVNGTVRRWLLNTQGNIAPSQFGLEILSEAEFCMVTNALNGLIPVTKIGQHRYDVYPGIADLNTQYQQSSN